MPVSRLRCPAMQPATHDGDGCTEQCQRRLEAWLGSSDAAGPQRRTGRKQVGMRRSCEPLLRVRLAVPGSETYRLTAAPDGGGCGAGVFVTVRRRLAVKL